MKKTKFLLVVDTEGGLYYKIPSPHFSGWDILKWKINILLGKLYKYANPATDGVKNVVKILKKYKFPASFCICGHLYLKECAGWNKETHAKKPENPWYKRLIGDWYYWDDGKNKNFCFGSFIEKEMKENYFSFGLHGFAHEPMTLEKKEIIESIVKKSVEAAKKVGVPLKSFVGPFDMVEEDSDSNKIFDVLKKNKIKNVIYSGTDKGFEIHRRFRFSNVEKRNGLNLIWLTNYFEGSFSKKQMGKVFRDILEHKNKEGIYCLATHDFTHKNTKNIERVVRFIKNLEKKGEIEIVNLK